MEPKDKPNTWLQLLNAIQIKVDKNSYETWFEPTSFIAQDRDTIYIKVPNSYFSEWLSFHYESLIQGCSHELFGKVYRIKYVFEESKTSYKRKSPQERRMKDEMLLNPNLNPNYTFENFVVGSCNQFAHAASTEIGRAHV